MQPGMAQSQSQSSQPGPQPPPVQQLMGLNQSLSTALQTYASTFPGAEQEVRQMLGLLQQAQSKQVQVLEQMLGPQPTPQTPY